MPDVENADLEAALTSIRTTLTSEGVVNTIALAALLVVGGWLLAGIVSRVAGRALLRSHVEPTKARYLCRVLWGGTMALAVAAAMSQLGVPAASILAVLGAAALAIGLALQDTLANAAAGVIVIVLQPYRVGEFVSIAGVQGRVIEVAFFHTVLRARDNTIVYVPNSDVMDGNVVNFSRSGSVRLDLTFSIAYEADLGRAKGLLTELVAADPRILRDPAPVVAVRALTPLGVDFVVRPFVKLEDDPDVAFDLAERVRERFDKEGIAIPVPAAWATVGDERRTAQGLLGR